MEDDGQPKGSLIHWIDYCKRNVGMLGGFIHLRLRTGHDVEKKKFLREASLEGK
jgi:hypothetical protein